MQNTKELVGPHIKLKNSRDRGDGRNEIASNLEQWVVYRSYLKTEYHKP
jgi:hypothetical protein